MSDKLKAAMQHDIDYKYHTSDPPDVHAPTFTIINVPTTLSAGEYSPYAGGIDATDGIKKIFVLQSLFADVVILDPQLAQHSPEWVWMSSGVRSIDHCVELLGSPNLEIEAETVEAAETGLILVVRGLLKLRKDPKDLAARLETQVGSNFAMDGSCTHPLSLLQTRRTVSVMPNTCVNSGYSRLQVCAEGSILVGHMPSDTNSAP